MMMMMMMMTSGVGEAELHLARSDIADFLHARALSHWQLAISSFTRYALYHSGLYLTSLFLPQLCFSPSVDLAARSRDLH